MRYAFKTMPSPVGVLTLIASDVGLAAVLWQNDDPARVRVRADVRSNDHPVLLQAERELAEYFGRRRQVFAVPLDFVGTEFQKRVWHALTEIPFGQTHSYGQLARQLGDANASRAVGAANGKNPVSIIAPCHRVIGGSGRLTGFAGGLDAKQYLLALEANQLSLIGG